MQRLNFPSNLSTKVIETCQISFFQTNAWSKSIQGEFPDEAFYEKVQHPTSVMILGAIGPNGYQSDLLWFNQRVNSQYYY